MTNVAVLTGELLYAAGASAMVTTGRAVSTCHTTVHGVVSTPAADTAPRSSMECHPGVTLYSDSAPLSVTTAGSDRMSDHAAAPSTRDPEP